MTSAAYAAPPSRLHTYTTGTTIESSKVTANEDAIFNYLTAGVDTYANDTIINADINSSAGISDTKLDLATIAQDMAFNGTISTGVFTAVDINSGGIDNTIIGGLTPTNLWATTIEGTVLKATTSVQISTGTTVTLIADEDDLVSNSDEKLATQQSIRAYVDGKAAGKEFIEAGTLTFTTGVDVTRVYLTMVGGGGGGGGDDSGNKSGGGGGGGSWVVMFPYTVVGETTYDVIVGAGGAGGAAGANDGTVGADTRFDTGGDDVTVSGGNFGLKGATGTGGAAIAIDIDAGTAPAAGGHIVTASGAGQDSPSAGTGGGGAGGAFGDGGAGGSSAAGTDATGFGAGGGGGAHTGAVNSAGGDGSDGFILVEW